MLTIKKILFPTDFSQAATDALLQALYLAEQYKAELHFFHVMDPFDDPNNPSHHFPTQEEILELVQQQMASNLAQAYLKRKGKHVHVFEKQERGIAVAPTIVDYVSEHEIDLVVMGTHGRSGFGHLLLGSVAEEIVRRSPCPVMTIRGKKEGRSMLPINRILVPVDFSGHAQKALAHAAQLAGLYGAELQVLHVIQEIVHPAFYVGGRTSIFEFMPQVESESTKHIQELIDEIVPKDIPYGIYLREGHPTQEIVNFIEHHKSDLVVIATHGLTGIEHFLLGSVAEKVVRLAPVPVFTVKGFGKTLVEESLAYEISEKV